LGGYTMVTTERVATYWKNTKRMPFLLRMLCQGAMVAAPILLVILLLPITEWEINGRPMAYAELWSSGQGVAIAAFLAFVSVGTWGLAARTRASRWLLVSSPLAPYIVLALFPASPTLFSEPIAVSVIVSATLTAAAFYVCLFHLRSVREYLDNKGVGA
jgi:hypothetical protein